MKKIQANETNGRKRIANKPWTHTHMEWQCDRDKNTAMNENWGKDKLEKLTK